MEKISVIVPIYNRENALEKCLNSILSQTYRDLEIILVNDGSTDNSLEKCREYELKDSRVVVVDKLNGGVSSARNAGLAASTGKFVTFVDSDDYLDTTMYEKLVKKIEESDASLAACGYYNVFEDTGKIVKKIEPGLKKAFLENDLSVFFGISDNDLYTLGVVWRVLFLKSVVDKISFDEDMILAEDLQFLLQALVNVEQQKRCIVDEHLYFYVHASSDESGKYLIKDNYIKSQFRRATALYDLLKSQKLLDSMTCSFWQLYREMLRGYCLKSKHYVKDMKQLKKEKPFCFISIKKSYKSFKRKYKPSFKCKLRDFLFYHKCYRLLRLYYKVGGQLQNDDGIKR